MAITNFNLLAPTGPLEKTLFPGEDIVGVVPPATVLEERLDIYIAQAVAKNSSIAFADMDAANLAWSLYLAYQAAHIISVARPSTDNAQVAVLGSQAFGKDQRDMLLTLASLQYTAYKQLLAAVPSTAQPLGVPTRSSTNEFDW